VCSLEARRLARRSFCLTRVGARHSRQCSRTESQTKFRWLQRHRCLLQYRPSPHATPLNPLFHSIGPRLRLRPQLTAQSRKPIPTPAPAGAKSPPFASRSEGSDEQNPRFPGAADAIVAYYSALVVNPDLHSTALIRRSMNTTRLASSVHYGVLDVLLASSVSLHPSLSHPWALSPAMPFRPHRSRALHDAPLP
jgi:hypothetical protein